MAKTRPIYSRPIDGSTGPMMIRKAPAIAAVAMEMPKAMRLIFTGSTAISRSASWSCDTAMMARPRNVRDRNSCSPANSASETTHGISMRSGRSKKPKRKRLVDIGRLDIAVIDTEDHDQRHFGHEQHAEEESEPAQRFLSALFEGAIIDLVDGKAQQVEHRQHQQARQDGIDPDPDIQEIGGIGSDDDEGRMGDVDDVEHAE